MRDAVSALEMFDGVLEHMSIALAAESKKPLPPSLGGAILSRRNVGPVALGCLVGDQEIYPAFRPASRRRQPILFAGLPWRCTGRCFPLWAAFAWIASEACQAAAS